MDESSQQFTATMEALGEPAEMPEESQSPPSEGVFTDVSLVPEHEKKELEDAVSKLEGDIAELRSQLRHLDGKRREALDKLLDLKGSIRVFCRVRPFLQMEKRSRPAPITLGQEKVMIQGMRKKKDYVFDRVFSYEASQENVFAEIEPILRSALDGHSVCIFAYGQTGTGKTFTMEGAPDSHGIVPRAIKALLDHSSLDNAVDFKFSLSMVEVYMGHLKDLLAHRPPTRMDSACMSRSSLSMQTDSNGSVEIDGLIEIPLTDFAQAHKNYVMGRKARSTCWTNVNEASSRSHCLTRLTITRNEGSKTMLSKLWMVDLGGSERLLKTRATGQILDEGRAINLSLSALGDVISALRRKRNHIPYRNSKLTQILKDSLGHDSKALMVIHISAKEDDICETICSLNFGQRARGVECHKELSEELRNLRRKQIAELDQQLKDAEQDCQNVRDHVQRLECTLREKKRILSVTYGFEVQTGSPTSPLTAPKELFESPKASERTTARISASIPRFMASTACSRQRQLADREAKATKMQRSGMKHLTEIDFHLSRSRTLVQSDSNFKTNFPTGLLVRSSLKKLRTEELSSVQSDAASHDSSKILRAQHNRRFSASLSISQTRHLSDLNMQKRISDRRSSCEVSRYPLKNARLIRSSMPSCLELINGAGCHSLAESQC
ncbi:kinesin-like protein KIN-14O isoform X1 [Nymphaea colorata]|nr:kinesin-like protein KIN-14O isoform X1 [Nymphaea colorata]XP_031485681.1 kinesin-like protein KIN-14O isoform X1 [Nymphaea colorata]XP_031485682.1 kinesin-like protein KIN-14O isoform X1 [Nymphaea colorata]XP_031485683.1 kinesin-like protein KIN-14O isoform X1 [Nymphaea colorata]